MKRWLVVCGALVLTLSVGLAMAQEPKGKPGHAKPDPATIFKRVDTNGDGKISPEEFKHFLAVMAERRAGGRGKPEAGGAGGGEKTEAPAAKTGPTGKPEHGGQFADKLFEKLDTNHDGYLSQDEFSKVFELLQQFREKAKAAREKAQDKQ